LINILILEDMPADAELIGRELLKGGIAFSSRRVDSREDFVRGLEEFAPDIILADYKLPSFDGMSALKIAQERCPDTPLVFVTGAVGEEAAIEMLKSGATDYVLKDRLSRLVPAVSRALREAENRKALKQAVEELGRSKEFNETIFNCLGDPVSVIDPQSQTIIAANNAFIEKYGSEEKDIIGRHCYEVTHGSNEPCSPPEHPCPMVESLNDGRYTKYEHVHCSLDGDKIYVEVATAPVKCETGKIAMIIHAERDITDRRHLEEQIRQSQKMEAVGLLAGGVAHDFNNMLTAIMGYCSLVKMGLKEDVSLKQYVDQIMSAGEKAANLTQSLLAFSRKQILDTKPVKLNEIVQRIEKLLLRLIGEDIELKVVLGEEDLTIIADIGQIEQIIMNLTTNARYAMPEGGTLIIETGSATITEEYAKGHVEARPGSYGVVTASDTGVGMDERTMERIFEPFFTTKEVGRGTGLGLSIVYGIIKQHNGFINVYSEPGKGTTFRIYLPLIKQAVMETGAAALPSPAGGTETILVAEDNADVRGLIKTVLEDNGYKVIIAADGEEAVSLFSENMDKIRLVLLDIIMPKKDGKEAYIDIKKIKPDIMALFMSGYAADIVRGKGIIDEGLELLMKPVSPEVLLRKIREMLDS